MPRPSSSRWLLLFGPIFLLVITIAPLQYEPLAPVGEKPTAGEEVKEETSGGELEVKLPRFQAFGLAVLVKHAFPDTIGKKMSSRVQPYRGAPADAPGSAMHLILFALLAAHFLTVCCGRFLFHFKDNNTTLFSLAYGKLLAGVVFAGIILGLDAWSLFEASMRHEEFFLWLTANTNIESAAYATLLSTSIVVLLTILYSAVREQQLPTLIQKTYYVVEALILLDIILNTFTNIDVLLFLLSHPFPHFSSDFNPFFSPEVLEKLQQGASAAITHVMS
jgi:hypothetical protein